MCMRAGTIAILCILACTEEVSAGERHAFSHATEDVCRVENVWKDLETNEITAVKLVCVDGDVSYSYARQVGNQDANWPTLAWQDIELNEEVVCELEHQILSPRPNYFFVVVRTMKNCMRQKSTVSVEALPPEISGPK